MPQPRPLRPTLAADATRALAEKGMQQSLAPAEIRQLREALGLRQIQVARRLSYHRDTVRAWERERTDPHFRVMQRPARVAFCALVLGMLADPLAAPADIALRPAA